MEMVVLIRCKFQLLRYKDLVLIHLIRCFTVVFSFALTEYNE